MEGLRSLIRLQNWKVDEKRRELGALEATRSGYVAQGEALEREVIYEQQIASRDGLTEHYGLYASKVIERRETLEKQIIAIDKEISIIHDQLSLLYQEQKRFEISLERREKEAEIEVKRKDQIELDEMSMNMQRRNAKSA
jgi:hypothetical protein